MDRAELRDLEQALVSIAGIDEALQRKIKRLFDHIDFLQDELAGAHLFIAELEGRHCKCE